MATKSAEEIITQLGELIKGMWNNQDNPDGLRKALNDISVLNWALAMYQTEYEELERAMKTELDLEKSTLILASIDKGEPVNKSEIRATIALGAKRTEYNKTASALDKVKTMGRACEKAMDSLRSQLATIRGDLK